MYGRVGRGPNRGFIKNHFSGLKYLMTSKVFWTSLSAPTKSFGSVAPTWPACLLGGQAKTTSKNPLLYAR